MRKLSFQGVTLFVVNRVVLTLCLAVFFGTLITVAGTKNVGACSYYDMYGCGGYTDYSNYWSYPTIECWGCNYGYDSYGGGYYGYNTPYYSSFNYSPSPIYQYVSNPQTNRGNSGSGLSNYNYVQYPYYQYTYFQNPAPSRSQNTLDAYNYVQYPYPTYVYNR